MPDLIDLALAEDIGSGDITAKFFTKPGAVARAKIIARQSGCLAGIETAGEAFQRVDSSLAVVLKKTNGDSFDANDCVLEVSGNAASILTAERTALNFLQHLSGVATLARRFADEIQGTRTRILDTRKTTPGFRLLEKQAAAAGGARNHRMGLHDMFLVKDNHLATGLDSDSLQKMIDRARAAHPEANLEIEADTLEQVQNFYALRGVDFILLDNMSLADLREAVRLCPPHIQLEASGAVNLSTVRAIAETGVHFISVGAITHSAPSVDFGLDFDPAC
ncbi:MAG: carboxylating nicotinate-nucleotide diphosphorylase [Verrucomicrobia bacterium]|nr:carboxylating nicotinate-nucleotide diphosphorylase [Verrucomicrobiota bacterium]